ncbi:MAG: hypothetical protein ACLP8B_15160 [Xanthobacteraceae bacterium]
MGDRWVRCTDTDKNPVFVNLGNALALRPVAGAGKAGFTMIDFAVGSAAQSVQVRETPEEILQLKAE